MKNKYHVPETTFFVSHVRDPEAPAFTASPQVAEILQDYIPSDDREYFVEIFTDVKNKITGIHTVSIGTLTSSLVHPREVYRPAVLNGACSIIFGHNHPSGDATPSEEDVGLTKRLKECGDLLGIRVLDHVIIGNGNKSYYSFADKGTLQ